MRLALVAGIWLVFSGFAAPAWPQNRALPDTPVTQPSGSGDARPQHRQQKESADGFSCAGKSKCAQMDSCAEARFYLRDCGVTRLDRDHDGVPCESICR